MINNLKHTLLETGIVVDNEYLDAYCELIQANNDTEIIVHQTQSHHIIPRYYFKTVDNSLETDPKNKVNVLYKDHILAHYYLALCSSTSAYKAKNVTALYKMSNCPQTKIGDILAKDFINSLDHIQELYQEHAKHHGDHLRGKKQTSEHIAMRVAKNTGKKRSLETKSKMSAWQKDKPKSMEARENMRQAQLLYAQHETDEHKRNRVNKANETKANWSDEFRAELSAKLSQSLKGRVVSEKERRSKSLALTGKPKSEEHCLNVARARSKYRYFVNNLTFESTKEIIQYLTSQTKYDFPVHKWQEIINVRGEIDGFIITKELKKHS